MNVRVWRQMFWTDRRSVSECLCLAYSMQYAVFVEKDERQTIV